MLFIGVVYHYYTCMLIYKIQEFHNLTFLNNIHDNLALFFPNLYLFEVLYEDESLSLQTLYVQFDLVQHALLLKVDLL